MGIFNCPKMIIHFTHYHMFDCKFLPFIFDKTCGIVKVKTSFQIIHQGW